MKLHKISYLLVAAMLVASLPLNIVHASEFEGNEESWLSKCSVAQDSEEAAQKCKEFKEFYAQQSNALKDKVAEMEKTVGELNSSMSNIEEVVKSLQVKLDDLNAQIATAEGTLATMHENIALLDTQMVEKQAEIDQLDVLVKARMKNEQASLGVNAYIDVIMGTENLIDLLRIVDGINTITKTDREQMAKVATVKAELKLQQDEQERLSADIEVQIAKNAELKSAQEEGKKQQEILYAKYQKEQANIMQKMQETRTDISSIQGNIAGINTNIRDDIFEEPSTPETPNNPDTGTPENPESPETPSTPGSGGNSSWLKPISYRWYCGTWAYPGGYTHLGADYSGPIGAAVVAPSKSIVLYANAPYASNSGYLGNGNGWPYGGGNTIHLLTQVNGITYGVSFFHLSSGLSVSAGDLVEQGQQIALSGNSGNSTGPHLHVEVINLGTMSVTQAQAKFARGADFAWGTNWGDTALNYTCGVRGAPCRERPEDIFGY